VLAQAQSRNGESRQREQIAELTGDPGLRVDDFFTSDGDNLLPAGSEMVFVLMSYPTS
jgi:hypothetical protein